VKKKGRRRYVLFCVLAVLIAFFGAAGYFVYLEHEKDINRPARTRAAVLEGCHRALEDSLKAPATAQYSDERLLFATSRPDGFVVFGAVDSHNSYGALVRNGYICLVVVTADQESVELATARTSDNAAFEARSIGADSPGADRPRLPVCGLNVLSACFD
jgi:hypothetical protein